MYLEELLEVYTLKEILDVNNLTEVEVLEILEEEGHIVLPVI
jgi:hypothetical protein